LSIEAISGAFKLTGLSAQTKLTLIALANYANDQGYAWPSQKTISDISSQSERGVRKQLAVLEELGLIRRQDRFTASGARSSDVYQLVYMLTLRHTVPLPPAHGAAPSGTTCQDLRHTVPLPPAHGAGDPLCDPLCDPSIEPVVRATRPRQRHSLPDSFKLDDKLRQFALDRGMPESAIDDQFDGFREHHEGRGSLMKDWGLAWHTWVRKYAQWNKPAARVKQPAPVYRDLNDYDSGELDPVLAEAVEKVMKTNVR